MYFFFIIELFQTKENVEKIEKHLFLSQAQKSHLAQELKG